MSVAMAYLQDLTDDDIYFIVCKYCTIQEFECQFIHVLPSTDASKCLKILRVQKLAFLSPIPKFFRKISVLHVAAHPFQAILLLLTYYSTFKWAYG